MKNDASQMIPIDSGISGEMLDAAYDAARDYLPGIDVAHAKLAIIKAFFAVAAMKADANRGVSPAPTNGGACR